MVLLFEWGQHLLTLQLTPVEPAEPGVAFDLLHSLLASQSAPWCSHNQPINEVSRFDTPSGRYLRFLYAVLFGEDGIPYFHPVVAGVGTLHFQTSTFPNMSSYAIIPIA